MLLFDFGDVPCPDLLIARFDHLELCRQIDPKLESRNPFRSHLRHFFMHDPTSGRHPLKVPSADAAGVSQRILVLDLSSQHISYRFDPSMGMQGKPGLIVTRIAGLKVIQQQKWIQIVQLLCSNTSFESDSRTFGDRLRLNDLFDFSR